MWKKLKELLYIYIIITNKIHIMTTLDLLITRINAMEKRMRDITEVAEPIKVQPEVKRAIPTKKPKVVIVEPIAYPQEELVEEPVDTDDSISDTSESSDNKPTTKKKRITGYTEFQRVMRDDAEQSIYDEAEVKEDVMNINKKPKQYLVLKRLAIMWKDVEPEDKAIWHAAAAKINGKNKKA